MQSLDNFAAEMKWEEGRAQEHCSHNNGCKGPTVSSLSHGPDAGGRMVVSACEGCANRIKRQIPEMNLSEEN